MTPHVDLDVEMAGPLGPAREWSFDEVRGALSDRTQAAMGGIEVGFGQAGWYEGGRDPYPPPAIPAAAPLPTDPPVVDVDRRLWFARYNPSNPDFSISDIGDDEMFPWQHPESAPHRGWWLSSRRTPRGRPAIREIDTDDLVICQRTNPNGNGGDIVGICAVGMKAAWNDAGTGEREHAACLVPLAKFTHPVPRNIARRHDRLRVPSLNPGRQLPGRGGGLGFGLSYVEWDDAVELLSVCGIPPDALSEPDNARLAARLRASDTGNRLFFRLRYDAVLRDRVRRTHEREAERAAEAWAARNGYVKIGDFQTVPLAGFDLLFVDGKHEQLQVEVKGNMSRRLADVRLQPSQAVRATDAVAGLPPDWRLYALLGAGTNSPDEHVLRPDRVVKLIGSGGIQVKGGWPPTPRTPEWSQRT